MPRFELWFHEDDEGAAYELLGDEVPRGPANLPAEPGARIVAVIEAESYEAAKQRQHELLGWEPYKPFRGARPGSAETAYPELFQFLGGYFHQDWALDATTPTEVVRGFLAEAPTEQVAGVVAEVDRLLAGEPSDAALARVVYEELGCDYDPTPDGVSVRDWLRHVRASLTAGAPPGPDVDPAV